MFANTSHVTLGKCLPRRSYADDFPDGILLYTEGGERIEEAGIFVFHPIITRVYVYMPVSQI